MMLLEMITATLLGLAVAALLIAPLLRSGGPAQLSGVDEPEDVEETRKGAALAALREIEFDRATGKLSDEDYHELNARYTERALEVLRSEDADALAAAPGDAVPGATPSDPVEALIADRVRTLQASSARCPSCGPRPESDALFCSGCGRSLAVGGCASCGSALIPGSRFCEECGTAIAR
ncbi:MAG: zinc ribbon domain-containing protein [Gemmatimonadota bacterium]|nr:zinc ribbon domain-containing protein [Gemmatimonadota bacterium]MDH5283124.1 zinc ribbon domain-containing protein [Gemmatimonadota bacterium]